MKFKEYSDTFEGDICAEGRKLLGNRLKRYNDLQRAIYSYPLCKREEHLKNIQEFYSLAVASGVKDLVNRADTLVPWIAEQMNETIEGRKVVDVGCCDGFFTVFYALNHPDSQFIGIDISKEALDAAKTKAEKFGAKNINWILEDVLEIDQDIEEADTIILQDALYQLCGHRNRAKECSMLNFLSPFQRKGGIVVIGQEGDHIAKTNHHGYVFDERKLEKRFDRNNNSEEVYEIVVFRKA